MSRWMTGMAIGLLAGMMLSAWFGAEAIVYGLLLAASAIVFASLFPDRQRIVLGIACFFALILGMFLYTQAYGKWQVLPEKVSFSGSVLIIERGAEKVFYRPLTVRPRQSDWSGGDILYRAPIDVAGVPGEELQFSCDLVRPENFEPGFDYRNLLASRGTGYVCERGGESSLLSSGEFSFRRELYALQSGFRARVNALLPEPESGLLTGLLIGGSDTLAPETKDAFARAGLSHIVAVSGYNMSVVAEGLVIFSLILGLWRRSAVVVGVIGLAGFLLVIDGSAASLRAAFMTWLAFGAYFVGRPNASWNGLLIAAAVMLVMNPLLIRFDVGFQLSFLATLALLVFARSFETFDFFRRWYGKVAALFLTTVVIELFTLPVIVSAFGTLSLIAPFANALVLPLIPLAMFTGIAATLVTAVFPVLSFVVMPLVWLPLALVIRLAEGMAGLPMASLSGLDIAPVFAVLWYVGLGIGVYFLERTRKRYVLGMGH